MLWSHVVKRKNSKKCYTTSKPNCDKNSLRYLNQNKRIKTKSDVRFSAKNPTVLTKSKCQKANLARCWREEGTLLVIEICPGTACLVLQWTPAERVASIVCLLVNLTMIWWKFDSFESFKWCKKLIVDLYQCARVTTSRMLTFPKVCDLFCVML